MRNFAVRRANTADAGGIAKVHIDSWRSTYSGIVDPEVLASLSYESREQRWLEWLGDGNGIVLVAEDSTTGRIVGFCHSGETRDRDPRFSSEIYAIYIYREFQGKGIGRALVSETARILGNLGYSSVSVWVLAENPNRRFYEKLGGRPIVRRAVSIGSSDLEEICFGWTNMAALI